MKSIDLLSNYFVKRFHGRISTLEKDFRFTVWKNEKFGLTEKIFRQINSLVFSVVKTLLSRDFCQRRRVFLREIKI